MKKQKESAFIKGMFSSLIILLLLSVLTVFPNLWETSAPAVNPVIFKAMPFAVIIISLIVILCISEGISFLFYSEVKRVRRKSFSLFSFFRPRHFFRLLKFYSYLLALKLFLFVMIFLPAALIFLCTFLFYKNGCPVLSVGIMSACAVSVLMISIKLYGEMNSALFLSKYIFFEKETARVGDIIKESFVKMKGRGRKIRILRQSFFLSFLSCIFIIPIPFVLTDYKYALSKKVCELMRK